MCGSERDVCGTAIKGSRVDENICNDELRRTNVEGASIRDGVIESDHLPGGIIGGWVGGNC